MVRAHRKVQRPSRRVVRRRFDDRDVERVNRRAWWDRPPAEIEAALAILERGGAAELERHLAR